MNTSDFNLLQGYIKGKIHIDDIWYEEVKWLFENKQISRIYEIYNNETTWYLIIDKGNCKYIVNHNINDDKKVQMMEFTSSLKNIIRVQQHLLLNYYRKGDIAA